MPNRFFWQDKAGEPAAAREGPVPSEVENGSIVVKAQAWAMNLADHVV
jgi:hypothetical protein